MKNFITLLVFSLFSLQTFSQETECPRLLNPDFPQALNQIANRDIDATAPTNENFVFNVKIHFVRNTNGEGVNFGKDQAQNAMMILNETYNKIKIYFKLAGFDYINNSEYKKIRSTNKNTNPDHPTLGELISYSKKDMEVPVFDENALNIYVVETINENPLTFGGSTNGIGYLPGTISFYTYKSFLSTTLLHEIGHNFNLEHTYNLSGTSKCELVSGENATIAGDYVTDTPATPLILPASDYSASCSYVNTMKLKDCAGTEFKEVLLSNIMGHDNPCRDLLDNYQVGDVHFTKGQAERMRDHIYRNIMSTENMYGYNKAKTTIDKLYQPTEQYVVVSNNEIEVTDDEEEPGVANVCKKTEGISYEFQKGFKYTLTCDDGSKKVINSNETPKIVVKKPFNVKIEQISQTKSVLFEIDMDDELQCEKQKYVAISIASSNNLANGSIQFKQLTDDEIKTTNVFNSLPNKTYSIITKETDSGLTTTKKIYKY